MKIVKSLIMFFTILLVSSMASASELHIAKAPETEVNTIVFEVPNEIPSTWFPLRETCDYLPIKVSWDAESREIIIDSEPNRMNWHWLAHEEISVDNIDWYSKNLEIVDGVTYCSPWFLANRLTGVGFVHNKQVWYCNSGLNFSGYVDAAMLELKVVAPEDYSFVTKHLTGGVKMSDTYIEDAYSYVYPHSVNPVCYIVDDSLNGSMLASTIAHEAWHVYDAKRGVDIDEDSATAYENKIFNLLMKEIRIKNGTIWMYE